ncbi:hypothetical protein NMY22_g15649 [Coprinellus aureogranulatus]|nr:hypothetical protein NMY22_g15649 [Coprinellus aureogranulatus]
MGDEYTPFALLRALRRRPSLRVPVAAFFAGARLDAVVVFLVVEKRVVKLATTQVTLPDDVTRSLAKLGVTMASKPPDCTHLLAAAVVRTEKFLSAVATGAHILKKEWAIDSAKAGKLLPEAKYELKDPGNKHGVDLQQSLQRARQEGKLFAGKTFYVAGKTATASLHLLKNIVAAGGGQLKEVQKLTQRIISGGPERYAISAQEDASVWRQLAESGTPVYSVELIIAGTLNQKFDPQSAKLELTEED